MRTKIEQEYVRKPLYYHSKISKSAKFYSGQIYFIYSIGSSIGLGYAREIGFNLSGIIVLRPVVDFRKSFQPERDMDKCHEHDKNRYVIAS